MKKILLTTAIILAAAVCCHAESRTFVREYYYQAGESDSKITSRTKALTEVKRLLLEEIGVYLESYINYSEEQNGDRISNQFLRKEIEQISAGITETTILEENWTGVEYYIKAKESEIASLRQSLETEQEKLRQQEDNLQRLNKELSGLKSRYTQIAKQEQAVQSEIDRIRRAFNQSTSKASQVLIGMNADDVIRLCGEPRSNKTIYFVHAGSPSSGDAWDYGNITIIFDQSHAELSGGIVIKGVKTVDLNYNKADRCQNILGSLYSK